jgi:ribosomal protein S18 acetylase RimI-like enzyme
MDLRILSSQDIEALELLVSSIFDEVEAAGYYPIHLMRQYREAYTPERLALKVSQADTLLLGDFDNGRLVAFLIGNATRESELYLEWMGVQRAERAQGVGSALIERACRWAEAHFLHVIWLYVAEKNAPAQRFYAAHGFVTESTHSIGGWQFLRVSRSVAASQRAIAA